MMQTLYEYQLISNEELKKHIIATPTLHPYFKMEWESLKASHYCGILHYNQQDYYILPKIAHSQIQNLNTFIYMFIYAYDIKLSNEDIASCANHKYSILEVLVQLFAKGLLNEFKKGIYKEYITEQDNLTTLRGKYLVNENLKYNYTKNKIYCEYDEFSPNNALNQFFLYALKYLQRFIHDKKLLMQCEVILDEVDSINVDLQHITIHFHRLNQRFKQSYELALLILRQLIPLFAHDKQSFAFLFDMNQLFEKFIARILKELDETTQIQNQTSFNDLTLKPDIITTRCIIDTKYKKLDSNDDLKQSDKLQAFAYGVNYQKDVMLLYPKHLKSLERNLVLGDVKLQIASIDLDFVGNYQEYIKEMKTRMKGLLWN